MELTVVLSRPRNGSLKEKVCTQNVSSHGLRVITKKMWQPGARLRVNFVGGNLKGQASVIYCQRLTGKKFAVGLALQWDFT